MPQNASRSTFTVTSYARTISCLALSGILFTANLPLALAAPAIEYKVAVESIDYMPLYDGSDHADFRGYARDLLDLFGRKYGYKFSYIPLPINRLYKEFFVARNYDFKFPDNPNWQPDSKVDRKVIYSAPVVTLIEGLFVPASRVGENLDSIKSIVSARQTHLEPINGNG